MILHDDALAQNPAVFDKINIGYKAGQLSIDHGNFDDAIHCFDIAFDLLPEPKHQWSSAIQIQAGKGDACFLKGDFTEAGEAFRLAVLYAGPGNPFLHLRYGQCLYETGERDKAIIELTIAHKSEGDAIFAGDGAQYLAFLKKHI